MPSRSTSRTSPSRVDALRPNESAPASAKFIAATSLVLWIGVIYWGRMLPFLGGAF